MLFCVSPSSRTARKSFFPAARRRSRARLLGQALGEALKQQFVIDNRPGASGNIGAEAAAKSTPDGYTFLVSANPALTVNPNLYKNLPYNAERDFSPVAQAVIAPQVICVHPSLSAKTLAKLGPEAQNRLSEEDVIRETSFHCWGNAQGLMDSLEVVRFADAALLRPGRNSERS